MTRSVKFTLRVDLPDGPSTKSVEELLAKIARAIPGATLGRVDLDTARDGLYRTRVAQRMIVKGRDNR